MSLITDEKRSLFHSYASEFEKKYLLEPAGQKHLALYKKEGDEVTLYWSKIKKAKQAGEQIIDLVVRFIKNFTIKNIYGIVPSKTMEGLCQVKAEDQN